jgi:protein-L-isoaspartate(D-aspartate) O-methyltransferase
VTNFQERRTMMVDTQVRPSDVTKFPIIDAMLRVPREDFVPSARREAAYMSENLPLGQGRVVLDPRSFAKMLDGLDVEPSDVVLDIGSGLGYSAAVLAQLAEAVVAVEDEPAYAAESTTALAEFGADNVAVVEAPLSEGAAKHGPYDAILIEGGVADVPSAILEQLKEGGRIAAIFMDGALGTCRIGHLSGGHVNWRYAFNASAPVLAGFEAASEFTF